MIKLELVQDNNRGIQVALEGNIGVEYFIGQTLIFLSERLYKNIGRKKFEKAVIKIFGAENLRRSRRPSNGRNLVSIAKFPEHEVYQIELPKLRFDTYLPTERIDPELKVPKLVDLINKYLTDKN